MFVIKIRQDSSLPQILDICKVLTPTKNSKLDWSKSDFDKILDVPDTTVYCISIYPVIITTFTFCTFSEFSKSDIFGIVKILNYRNFLNWKFLELFKLKNSEF